MAAKLNSKQERFCYEYIIDNNATQAAIRAEYSKKTARQQGSRLLSNVDVQERIAELKEVQCERLGIDADYVLKRIEGIDKLDASDLINIDGTIKSIHDWPKEWRISISGIDFEAIANAKDQQSLVTVIKKIKWPDKVKNLELMGKHVNVQAFKEQRELSGKDGKPITVVTTTPEEVKQAVEAIDALFPDD